MESSGSSGGGTNYEQLLPTVVPIIPSSDELGISFPTFSFSANEPTLGNNNKNLTYIEVEAFNENPRVVALYEFLSRGSTPEKITFKGSIDNANWEHSSGNAGFDVMYITPSTNVYLGTVAFSGDLDDDYDISLSGVSGVSDGDLISIVLTGYNAGVVADKVKFSYGRIKFS